MKKNNAAFLLLLPLLIYIANFCLCQQWSKTFLKLDRLFLYAFALYALLLLVVFCFLSRHITKFVLLLYAFLMSFVLLEISLWLFLGNSNFGKLDDIVLHHPNINRQGGLVKNLPGISGKFSFKTNQYRLRGAMEKTWEEYDVKILCVGGSTTECLYVEEELSWPYLLQNTLQKKIDKSVYVGNAGKSGMYSVAHSYLLEHYPYLSKFECIVVLCGINDLGALLRDNYEERSRELTENSFDMFYHYLSFFKLVKKIYIGTIVQDLEANWVLARRKKRQRKLEMNTITVKPRRYQFALDRYKADLRKIIDICRKKNKKLVLATQPVLWGENLSAYLEALLSAEVANGAYRSDILFEMMKGYNDVMRQVCKEQKILLVDLANKLPKDTSVFYDDCHFNVSGCQKVSDILTEPIAGFLRSK
ncbi:SGNH/GDSL hydrolase family protein [Candidatus Uabimicrobium amorphum]|uniref:SGNH hydrolase-type esterase domain-containing protein n=1 Tax=Uabimicrobium amorphum TaxID=2596890 RepID=A0A5S9IM05_UABAM|nr:SGNH/GDSL hydrolase family protein [Candidatus Uabimicrobium amorphum]BBM84194.1 hypothetical protein UABAM_02550 [Candidatus Uabimicrobium amorphum]